MNEVMKALLERRSIRKFKPDALTKEQLGQIVEAGLYAASGKGAQSAIAVVVTNKALRDRLSAENCRIGGWEEGFDPFYGAPAIILVLANKNEPNHVYDGSLMMGNMMLAAHALGLGSICLDQPREAGVRHAGVSGAAEGAWHRGRVGGHRPPRRRLYRRGSPRARRAEKRQGVLGGITFLEKGLCPFSRRGFAALCASAGR